MSKTYYYLAVSLPMLDLNIKPPISYARFLEDCRRLMAPADADCVEQATLTPQPPASSTNPFLRRWNEFKHDFQNEIARLRAQRAGRDVTDAVRGQAYVHPAMAEFLTQATKSEDPLSVEKSLDQFKWRFIDELSSGHYFDVDFLIGYGLKLQILERHGAFDSEAGPQKLDEYKEIHTQAKA